MAAQVQLVEGSKVVAVASDGYSYHGKLGKVSATSAIVNWQDGTANRIKLANITPAAKLVVKAKPAAKVVAKPVAKKTLTKAEKVAAEKKAINDQRKKDAAKKATVKPAAKLAAVKTAAKTVAKAIAKKVVKPAAKVAAKPAKKPAVKAKPEMARPVSVETKHGFVGVNDTVTYKAGGKVSRLEGMAGKVVSATVTGLREVPGQGFEIQVLPTYRVDGSVKDAMANMRAAIEPKQILSITKPKAIEAKAKKTVASAKLVQVQTEALTEKVRREILSVVPAAEGKARTKFVMVPRPATSYMLNLNAVYKAVDGYEYFVAQALKALVDGTGYGGNHKVAIMPMPLHEVMSKPKLSHKEIKAAAKLAKDNSDKWTKEMSSARGRMDLIQLGAK